MTTRPTSSRGVEAAVTGAVTAVYYATPDFIPSRRARGWAKAGLVAASVAAAIPGARAARATAREAREEGSATSLPQAFGALTTGREVVALAFLAAVLTCSVAGVVAAERRALRQGQARAAAGRRLAHTGPALLYGALAGALRLVPAPPDTA